VNMLPTATAAEVKALRALNTRGERQRQGRYLAEGDHLCGEAIREGQAISLLVQTGREEQFARHLHSGLPVQVLSAKAFSQISDTRTPQGIAALCRLPADAGPNGLGYRVVALNGVQDPGNVGTILRTMDAAGFTGLLLDRQSADPYSPKALRAAMGAAFRLPVCQCDSLADQLREMDSYDIIAGSLEGASFYQRGPSGQRVCLLIGSEGGGLSPDVLALATQRLRLPMPGRAESLNAAVAASIMMYDFVRVWEQP